MASVNGSKSVLASSDDSLEIECDPCSYEGEKKKPLSTAFSVMITYAQPAEQHTKNCPCRGLIK